MLAATLTALALTLTGSVKGSAPARLGPWFAEQPPPTLRYAAAGGARLACVARGEPTPRVAWLAEDGAELHDVPGVRRTYSNGTLELFPSARAEPAVVRCRATSPHGAVVSRDVLLEPVSDTPWEVSLSDAAVEAGGVAALWCRAEPAAHAEHAAPALFYRGDDVLHVDGPTPDAHYVVAGGALLLRDVRSSDAGAYSCLARHALTAHTRRSRPARLAVLPADHTAPAAPRPQATARELRVAPGAAFCLPCAARALPAPQYAWYRERAGHLTRVADGELWSWAGGAALCTARAAPEHAGAWLCKAHNALGDATVQLRVLIAPEDFTVRVEPSVLVAQAGSTVRFNCSCSAPGAVLRWARDGAALSGAAGPALLLRGVTRAHRGLYQCEARRGRRTERAAAELRLADSPPELLYTFIEQALRGGGSVALRCVAAAAPPPRITWLLDGQPLERYLPPHRYSVSEEAAAPGELSSTLNVTTASSGDGGRYTCRASNALGTVEHSARLNIYGPPTVRTMAAARAVAGENFTLHCPYAGYPISTVTWRRRGSVAVLPGAGRVASRGAELRLAPAQPHDAGHYSCTAVGAAGPAASADVELQVRNPPKISPFLFSPELAEGSSAQVLCGVSSGDKPLYFSWLKDGAPLPPALQVEEKNLNEFSLLMFSQLTARHSGAYTCRVANHAAAATYTATLSVRVPPTWLAEPHDAAALLGAPLRLPCAAAGHPPPLVTWARRGNERGDGVEDSERWEAPGPEWEVAADGALVGRAASRAHRGLYRCSADNGVGAPLGKLVTVAVHEPPHFGAAGDTPRNMSCVRGQGVELVCEARGDAPLAVHWTHRGTALDLSSYRWALAEERRADGLRSVLGLRSAEPRDAGAYRCHARNPHGRADALFVLTVEEPPAAPRALRLAGAGARVVRVSWLAQDAPGVHYAALCTPLHAPPTPAPAPRNLSLERADNDVDADGFSLLRARVDGLRPAAAYALRVLAANRVGSSPPSDALLFTTLEEAPAAAPQNLRARAAAPEELLVSWAPPPDGWNGELLGYAVAWREVARAGVADGPREDGAAGGTAVARGRGASQLTLGGLRPFARYALSARAFNRAGPGPPAPTVYAATADGVPEEPPRAVSCEAAGARALRVRWLPPPGAPPARGYDVLWAAQTTGEAGEARAAGGEALLGALRGASEYAVRVRARSERGAGPASPPLLCRTSDDVPGAVEHVRALAAGADAVRVSWAAPSVRGGRLTHYTLVARERGASAGAERSARVPADDADEAWLELRGLRERAIYEFWVRAATSAGEGAPGRPASAMPQPPGAARVSSPAREVRVALGARVRLRCGVVGAPPVLRRWAPLPRAHTVTDAGELVIHKVEQHANYTCTARNAAGADSATFALRVMRPPATPALRLARADMHALHLAWEPPGDGGAPLTGYTLLWWSGVETGAEAAARRWRAGATSRGATLRGLACGAQYRVALRAHNTVGASPPSRTLALHTRGDKAVAPAARECIWANATALRVALLAWGGRCAVERFSLALRARGGTWRELPAQDDQAEAGGLQPGAWYEIRVVAHAPAGDTLALYRAATLTADGERIGEPAELPLEARAAPEAGDNAQRAAAWWRGGAGAAAALLGAALALLLGAAALLACRGRRRDAGTASARPAGDRVPPPSEAPLKYRAPDELHEISPYATFSMSSESAGDGVRSCALHVRAARSPHALGAPPPRPLLLAQPNDYGSARDSDSESSGSPCAACAAELYRAPAHDAPPPPAESSTEDGSYAARRHPPRARARRRDHPAARCPAVSR